MKCKAVLREIEELDRGARLSPEAEAHLHTCAACRAFRTERSALRGLLASVETVEAPPDFDWRLRARLANERGEALPSRSRFQAFIPGARALTIAASVTLLLVAVVVYRQAALQPANSARTVAAGNLNEGANTYAPLPNLQPVPATPLAAGPADAVAAKRKEGGQRNRDARGVKANVARMDSAGQTAMQAQRILSNDYASRGADELAVTGGQSNSGDGGPVISVRLPAPKAAQLKLEDGQGVRRTLSPVNFGGQELIERPEKARLVPASEKGIW